LQSALSVEALLRRDLALRIALEMDRAGINGSGTANQPRGLLNTSGIGSVAGGANGLAPTWDNIVGLETLVDNANGAVGNLGYLTNSRVRGRLKRTQRFSSTDGAAIWEAGNEMNGYKAAVSNQVPSNLTKGTSVGTCSAIMFGNWADMLIGMWGGLDILVNPYIGSGTGTVRIEVFQSVDVTVRQPGSFAAMADALTV
jgi:HK97 family phage major capsid protein